MESGYILDSQITASSEFDGRHTPHYGRLNFPAGPAKCGCWAVRHNDPSQWLQVDFVKKVSLGKVATQGRDDYPQWVTSYSLSYSMNGINFDMYEQDGSPKVRAPLPYLYVLYLGQKMLYAL